MQVTCIWEFMKVKEKKSPKEQLVYEFLCKVNPSGWRTKRKAALSELEYTILNNGEQIEFPEANLVKMILIGTKQHPKGLLRICGEHSVSNLMTPALTRAAIIALKLLAKLLDASIYSGAKYFLEQLKAIPSNSLSLPNFGHHLVRDNALESGTELFESAMHVITAFLLQVPNLKLSDFIHDDWARYFYLRQAVGHYTQNPNNTYWATCVFATNFSHSMITEFLGTSKHRMSRDLWLKSITTYLINCKPILRDDSVETLLAGVRPKIRGLMHMCNKKNNYSPAARGLLAQLIDENVYPDAPRLADFLLKHKKLLAQLTLPMLFAKQQATGDDDKIYEILTKRGSEVKEALLAQIDSTDDDFDKTEMDTEMDTDIDTETLEFEAAGGVAEIRLRRSDSCLADLKKTYGKLQHSHSSDISWGDISVQAAYPSVLSVLDDSLLPTPLPQPSEAPSPDPISPTSPTSSSLPDIPLSPLSPSTPLEDPSPRKSASPLSLSPISSARTSEEYSTGVTMLDPPSDLASPRSAMSDEDTPRKHDETPSNQVINVLTAFFEAHGQNFSRIDYRRLLIFLLYLVTSRGGKLPDVDSVFLELGLDSNPQFEVSAAQLFEALDTVGANFTDELSNRWATCIMREIAATEKNLDP